MTKQQGWILLAAVLAVGIWIASNHQKRVHAELVQQTILHPVMGWKTISSQTFVLQPAGGQLGWDVAEGASTTPTIEIKAKSPVQVSWIPASFRNGFMTNANAYSNMPIYFCLQQHLLGTSYQCTLNTRQQGYFLYIRDERTPADMLGAGILAGLGVKAPANQELLRNDVTVEVKSFGCVANCQN